MKKRQALIILFFVLSAQVVFAQVRDKDKSLKKIVESSSISQKNLGLIVANEHGETVFAVNADKKFMPASLTKIITAAAALEKFEVGHQFMTSVLAERSKIKKSILSGDLYLRGGGDAGFVSESMWFLVNEFMRSGIREVSGDIIVDDSRFDSVRFDLSRDQDRVDRAYDSPIGAMTFNWSAVNIFVRPGAKSGEPAVIFADPESEYIRIINKTKTSAGSKSSIQVSNLGYNKKYKAEEIMVSGTMGLSASEFVSYKSITKPEVWAGQQFREFLKRRGVVVKGSVSSGVTPKSAEVVATYKSKPIGDLVYSMMKFSNNYIAEILTKNLGVEIKGEPGTMEKGVDVLRAYLKESGVKDAEIFNPSGLSRKNKFAPNDILRILLKVKNNFKVYPEYLSSLPIAGVDGTLKRRMGKDELNGQVRAKTGHLTGVAGLGGFASAPSGEMYSFIFLYNGGAKETYDSKVLFDKLVLELLKP
ncbi:MAG: D-alanyl-D-alanine carboxypeptidase/D-alanyl-D-alanine-endopeptidase [Bdellovibrionales bacterium]|nr:D-alanyl-D-alanine carboxypeptidase/D-alanyl-D-alanine-endopeptidase [Bdellovibrionales bacterium]